MIGSLVMYIMNLMTSSGFCLHLWIFLLFAVYSRAFSVK